MNKRKITIGLSLFGLLIIVLIIGISYAYYKARVSGNETSQSIAGTPTYLELTYTDGTPAINANDIMPGWSASKTFTVENTGEAKAYYVLKVSNIINTFTIPGSISFKIESSDGGRNVGTTELPISSEDLTSAIEIDVGVIHHYTITTYYNNLDVDQSPDLGANFSYTITIGAVRDDIPDYWRNAPEGSLLAAIKKNNPTPGSTWTTAGNQNSTQGNITVLSPNADQQAYYWTYGDGYTITSGTFSITNPTTCVYSSCYTSLLGKYMVGYTVPANSDSTDTMKATTGLTYVYKVIYAAPTEIRLERYQYLDRGTSESYRYWTTGTNAESASANATAKYNLTGVSVIDYTNNYSDLIGKYLGSSSSSTVSLSYVAASTPSTTKTTTNLSYLYQVVDATSTYIVYKSAVESSFGKTEDDYGTSYYYRGAVENNYVSFAGMCWRIVRIDGAGNIKLVLYNYNSGGVSNPCDSQYDATDAAFARYDSTTNGLAGKSAFNTSYQKNAYIGFMYGTAGSSSYEAEHANTNDSTILTNLKTWYDAKFSEAQKAQLADVIWCNDKSLNTNSSFNPLGSNYTPTNLGYNTEVTYYGAETRLIADNAGTKATTSKVSLVCPEAGSDGKLSKYTASDKSNGNGYLNGYKIGLLTADEIAFAGAEYGTTNRAYYLNENSDSTYWWSLSPSYYNGSYANVWVVYSTGTLLLSYTHFYYRVRPAVSLVPTVSITSGTGTQVSPFIIGS